MLVAAPLLLLSSLSFSHVVRPTPVFAAVRWSVPAGVQSSTSLCASSAPFDVRAGQQANCAGCRECVEREGATSERCVALCERTGCDPNNTGGECTILCIIGYHQAPNACVCVPDHPAN
jgi:hypothetical protein